MYDTKEKNQYLVKEQQSLKTQNSELEIELSSNQQYIVKLIKANQEEKQISDAKYKELEDVVRHLKKALFGQDLKISEKQKK